MVVDNAVIENGPEVGSVFGSKINWKSIIRWVLRFVLSAGANVFLGFVFPAIMLSTYIRPDEYIINRCATDWIKVGLFIAVLSSFNFWILDFIDLNAITNNHVGLTKVERIVCTTLRWFEVIFGTFTCASFTTSYIVLTIT